jgi:hypothetical protein
MRSEMVFMARIEEAFSEKYASMAVNSCSTQSSLRSSDISSIELVVNDCTSFYTGKQLLITGIEISQVCRPNLYPSLISGG